LGLVASSERLTLLPLSFQLYLDTFVVEGSAKFSSPSITEFLLVDLHPGLLKSIAIDQH
jgi:hypothetical protein